MAQSVTWNGISYSVPDPNDTGWAPQLTAYLVALPAGALQKSGGTFTLTSDVDFGAAFGLKSSAYKSRTANISATGVVRLANTSDAISWRNAANNADLALLVNASNQLTFNGVAIAGAGVFTASRAIVSDGSGNLTFATTTAAEIGFVNGVTSAIQTQINAKAPTASPTFTGVVSLANGSPGAPALNFGDATTGIYRSGVNAIDFSISGVQAVQIDSSGQILGTALVAGAPSFAFIGDGDTGMFNAAANIVGFAAGGSTRFQVETTQVRATVPYSAPNGSVGTPAFYFNSSPTTGFYQANADRIAVSLANFQAAEFATAGTANDTHYAPLTLFAGAGGGEIIFDVYTTASVTTAKKIGAIPGSANLFIVYGDSGSGNTFCDLVLCGGIAGTPSVILSKTVNGSPAARTYSQAAGQQMSVAMASGTYTIRTYGIGVT